MSLKKSPSVVSVITADEIEKSGARDLMDVLQMIPGIEFNMDVQGSVGISIRGLWAQEGKVLVLYDGQEMNDIAYAAAQFGQRYPINQIKKVEMIRGPGSASYGGYAEYAVINIITKNGADLKGVSVSSTIGQTANTFARQNLNIAFGDKKNDLTYSFSGMISRGQRSNLTYTDVYGSSYSMVGNSDINAWNANAAIQYKNLSFRFVQDNLYTTQRDQFSPILSKAYRQDFTASFAELKYQKQVLKNLAIEAKANYKIGKPWHIPQQMDSIDEAYLYQITTERYRGNVSAIWNAHRAIHFTFGMEAYHDQATKTGELFFTKDSTQKVVYLNTAPYLQTLLNTRFANVTLGARYDNNSAFGGALSPRLGITKKLGPVNVKLLYASSFRAPSIENIQSSVNDRILPETSKTLEFEAVYQINRNSFFTINTFNIETKNSIYFFILDDTVKNIYQEGYSNNTNPIGTRGLEAEYKYKSRLVSITASYSYHSSLNKDEQHQSFVSIDKTANLGIAQHKFSASGTYNINANFFATASCYVLGKRYGITAIDSLDLPVLSTFNPQVQVNMYIGCKNLIKGFTFGVGVRNLTDQRVVFIQPYNSMHAPLPGMGREFNFKLVYTFSHE